ncbi:MAG: hypothetical protein ACYTGH_07235, partial [Planctomycetota bacterium]
MAHILLVNGNLQEAEVLAIILGSASHRVHRAPDNQAALEHLCTAPIDLTLIDIGRATPDSFKLIEHLHYLYPDHPVIAISGG